MDDLRLAPCQLGCVSRNSSHGPVRPTVEPLERRLVVNQGDHDVLVFGLVLLRGDDQVAVQNAGPDHAVPVHPESE